MLRLSWAVKIDFTNDTASSSSDSFAVVGIDPEYISQESSFSNVRAQSRNNGTESSSYSDSFVMLNSLFTKMLVIMMQIMRGNCAFGVSGEKTQLCGCCFLPTF
jgi:hypothetical protein